MPESVPQVVILLLFVIPGFVFTKVFGFSVPQRGRETSSLILDSLFGSCLNYGLLSPLIWFIVRESFPRQHPILFAASLFFILIAFPALLATFAIRGIESQKFRWLRRSFRLVHPVPKAWDYFFRQGKQCWILANLKDGKVVAGLYSTNSFTSSYPENQDIYLEKLCSLSADGKMTGVIERSEGVIIDMDRVQTLEFYRLEE